MAKAGAQAVQIRQVGHDALGAGSADGRRLTSHERCHKMPQEPYGTWNHTELHLNTLYTI